MIAKFKNQSGFTLIEMLIVIVVLGILAMIIIPQITVSTEDAKVSTLQTTLSGIRSSIEIYYAQHNSTYPGANKEDGTRTPTGADGEAATAFVNQLTQYTSADGETANTKDPTIKFGPYIKGYTFPLNPFTSTANVTADYDEDDLSVRGGTPDSDWKIYPVTGVFVANDTAARRSY